MSSVFLFFLTDLIYDLKNVSAPLDLDTVYRVLMYLIIPILDISCLTYMHASVEIWLP